MYNNYDDSIMWQVDCDNTIKDKNYVILSSPTGSGKTKRYENWAFNKLERPIFITSPIKSLSNQKFRDLKKQGYNVGLETGDIKYIPNEDCDIICCTQEIYNCKYRHLENASLIIDEFSYIFENTERARAYIDSLYYSEAKNIMICSATFGNTNSIKQYIDNLTGKDFFLYDNKERLTTLDYEGPIKKSDIKDSLVVAYTKNSCITIAKEIYNDRLNKYDSLYKYGIQNSNIARKQNRIKISNLVKKYNITNEELIDLATMKVAYYYGGLYPKEKLFIEELFENKLIDTIVGTDALALGVNFPIKNVIFTQFAKLDRRTMQTVKIQKNLFEQISGRAGRKGYFDDGHVYYCDDFFNDFDEFTQKKVSQINNRETFYELVNSKNEDAIISLDANIADILLGNKTIEEEVFFITKYSTIEKDFDKECKNITETINYITSFDITRNYLQNRFTNLNFNEGYFKAIEHCSPNFKRKIETLSNNLMRLQEYFDKDIKYVYQKEYSPQKNCFLFMEILLNTPIKTLIKKYCYRFYDLLLLRNYLHSLPDKYRQNYNLDEIDKEVNNLDHTALHPYDFNIIKDMIEPEKITKQTNINKKKNEYKCPYYFDIISIEGKEYIKILKNDNCILASDYDSSNDLNLYVFPSNTIYKLSGLIKPTLGLKYLKNINLDSLKYKDADLINEIDEIKNSIIKKYKQK